MSYMYSRAKKANKSIVYIFLSLGLILINVLAVLFFLPNSKLGAKTLSTKAEAEVIKTTSSNSQASSTSSSSSSTTPSETASTISASTVASTESSETVAATESEAEVANEQVVYTTDAENYQASYTDYQYQPITTAATASPYASAATLSNGNTAGQIGSAAAAQMAAATGVPQSTWEHIIARESNGNPNVANASGASGLFQTMPGWGSTATVQDQVNTAIKVYNTQGMSAWGY